MQEADGALRVSRRLENRLFVVGTAPSAAILSAWDWTSMSAANSRLRWAALS